MRRLILLLLVATVLAAVAWPPGRAAASTLLLMPELFPNAPVRPLEWVTPAPTRETITLRFAGHTSLASLYEPGTPGPHGGVVIFLGVAPASLDDPRVVSLGDGLARIGLVTIVPQSQDLLNSKVDPGEVDEVIAAFDYLANLPEVDANRIGIGGFCIGAGLSLVAAEDPRINQRVALVNSFTGYYDLSSYAISILTRSYEPFPPEPGVGRVTWEPAPNATEVLADHLISLDPSPTERDLLRAVVRDTKGRPVDPTLLSPVGRTIWSALTTRDPSTAQRLLGELPPADRDLLRRLSPSSGIAQLHARVFIMHDYDDSTVPYVQSRLLAAHLKPGQGEYDEFHFFQHVDPTASVSPVVFVQDAARLAWHMFQIVEILQGAVPVERF